MRALTGSLHVSLVREWPVLASAIACALVGAALVLAPPVALVGVAAVGAAVLLSLGQRLPKAFLGSAGLLLAGYAFFGKGFAYLGTSPVYVGEVVLGIGLASLAVTARARKLTPLHVLLLLFMAWGALRTIPFVPTYGVDAVRDGAVWGYGAFAFAVSFAIRTDHIARLLALYRRLVPVFVVWVPIAAALTLLAGGLLPRWPGSGVAVLVFKGGDMGVHLTMVASFLLLGLYGAKRVSARASEPVVWACWFVGALAVVAVSRATIVALALALGAAFVLRSSTRHLPFIATAALTLFALALVDPKIPVGYGSTVSIGQFTSNVQSIVGQADDASTEQNLEGSEDFRRAWWSEIVSYTLEGPYFWDGKGYGINLADSDGFQLSSEGTLRAPHNTHMTILARTGVPGLAIWLVLQLGFAATLLTAFRRARRSGAERWAQIDAWLLIGWLAMMVNTTFDPYLEGPQGSIWFWSLFGLGLAALRLQRDDLGGTERELRAVEETS